MPFRWMRTRADKPDDGTGTDPSNPGAFVRVHISNRFAGEKPWYWTVSANDRRIGSGYEATKEEAMRTAEEAYGHWQRTSP